MPVMLTIGCEFILPAMEVIMATKIKNVFKSILISMINARQEQVDQMLKEQKWRMWS